MVTIHRPAGGLKPHRFFDKVNIRTERRITKAQLDLLRRNSNSANVNPGHHIRGYVEGVLTVVAPNAQALRLLAELPSRTMVNWLEPAFEVITNRDTRWALVELCDEHFVQGWHGRYVQIRQPGGSYTSSPDARTKYLWYADKPSKVTCAPRCFKMEGRHIGVEAVRRHTGVHHPRDLIDFDHEAYWRKRLQFYSIDLERLGRHHLNQITSRRRRYASQRDRKIGSMLFRAYGAHPKQEVRSVQRFVDEYGRGPYLIKLATAPLLVLFNVLETKFRREVPIKPVQVAPFTLQASSR